MHVHRLLLAMSLVAFGTHASPQTANSDRQFENYTQIEIDAARKAARTLRISAFRVCADPGNMPMSDQAGEGYENKLAELIAGALHTRVTYFWRPYIERGLTRQTFDENECDVLMDVPAHYGPTLTTFPIFRSTYVLASRTDRGLKIKDLDDPVLHSLSIGVYELSALRQSLADHGIVANVRVHEVSHDADLVPAHQPWRQVQDVVDGKLDVAGVWGPFAGWVNAMTGGKLTLQPTNRMDDVIPMEFDMSIGMRKTDVTLKFAIEDALNDHRAAVQEILTRYGVPLVKCGDCLISGTIPAHGSYNAADITAEQALKRHPEKPVVTTQQLKAWLAAGADKNQELSNAVLASDNLRIAYLLENGASVEEMDDQGYTPLTSAARLGNLDTVRLLLDHGAKPDRPDRDGWTPLLHAVLRNQPEKVDLLLERGADKEHPAPGGYSPLSVAVEEQKFDAAQALIDAGAKIDLRVSPEHMTALMVVASELPPENRTIALTQKRGPIEIARSLIKHGADVNAADSQGVTPLMIAAARDNAAMIGVLIQSGAKTSLRSQAGETAAQIAHANGSINAARMLDLLAPKSSN